MNKFFCTSPFYQIEISPHGAARVCCKMPGVMVLDENHTQYNLNKDTITDIWDSKWMHDFRKRFINEEKRPECKQCWDDEEAGILSFRQQQQRIKIELNKPVITELVLKLSNKCNCACRICNFYLSSLWESEFKKTNRFPEVQATWFVDGNKGNKITDNNWEDWKTTLKTVKHMSLYGGEPLINDEVLKILKYCADEGLSKNIALGLNTNGTVVSEKIFTLLNSFKHTNMHFSIDDVHARYNYERWPASYDAVMADLSEIHSNSELYDNMSFNLYTTISVFNILNLDNILTEFRKYPKFSVNFDNIIHEPSILVPYNLPEEVKPQVIKYLHSVNWHGVYWQHHANDYKSNIENFLNLYKSPYTKEEYIAKLDLYLTVDDERRGQNWKHTFPELYQLLS